MFQSTRPRGARHKRGQNDRNQQRVSIHAPTWGATTTHPSRSCDGESFNPRAHVGRDWGREIIDQPVSGCFNPRAHVGRDSQHRLYSSNHYRFQSTRPRGARLPLLLCQCRTVPVSIHAPTWGATNYYAQAKMLTALFQSTRPRGARRSQARQEASQDCFNPRAHVGRDLSPSEATSC